MQEIMLKHKEKIIDGRKLADEVKEGLKIRI
jgi:hypothetical protein